MRSRRGRGHYRRRGGSWSGGDTGDLGRGDRGPGSDAARTGILTVSVAAGASDRVVVMLTSPLEPEHVERITSAFPDRIEVTFRPDLMPAPRYVADHGDPSWRRNPAQEREWHRLLGQAEVLLDFPQQEARPLLELARKLRWVQTTSAGVGPLVQRAGLPDFPLLVPTASGIHA